MSEERWLHAVPVRIDGENVILRGNLGGGYWVRKIDEEEVPFDDLDTRPNDRDAWRECAVKLARHLRATRYQSAGCLAALAKFDELNSGRGPGQPTEEEQNHGN